MKDRQWPPSPPCDSLTPTPHWNERRPNRPWSALYSTMVPMNLSGWTGICLWTTWWRCFFQWNGTKKRFLTIFQKENQPWNFVSSLSDVRDYHSISVSLISFTVGGLFLLKQCKLSSFSFTSIRAPTWEEIFALEKVKKGINSEEDRTLSWR